MVRTFFEGCLAKIGGTGAHHQQLRVMFLADERAGQPIGECCVGDEDIGGFGERGPFGDAFRDGLTQHGRLDRPTAGGGHCEGRSGRQPTAGSAATAESDRGPPTSAMDRQRCIGAYRRTSCGA